MSSKQKNHKSSPNNNPDNQAENLVDEVVVEEVNAEITVEPSEEIVDTIIEETNTEEVVVETIEEFIPPVEEAPVLEIVAEDNSYYVGTNWVNGVCVDQKDTTTNIDDARKSADLNTKLHGVVYSVYNASGEVCFTSKKKLAIVTSLKKRGNKNVSWNT